MKRREFVELVAGAGAAVVAGVASADALHGVEDAHRVYAGGYGNGMQAFNGLGDVYQLLKDLYLPGLRKALDGPMCELPNDMDGPAIAHFRDG